MREVVVVSDGCTDNTVSILTSIADPRLKIIVNARPLGPSRSRNQGIQQTSSEWLALLDDDDDHSPGFLDVLSDVAHGSGAHVVGTPWLNTGLATSPEAAFAGAQRAASGPTAFNPSVVPQDPWVETVWLPNNVLVHRHVLDVLRFDEGYAGNYWREETDFFVSAVRAGFRVVATSQAFSYQSVKPAGGIARSNRFAYEFWVVRNDLRFILRHGRWLTARGYIPSRRSFLATSWRGRLKPLLAGVRASIFSLVLGSRGALSNWVRWGKQG